MVLFTNSYGGFFVFSASVPTNVETQFKALPLPLSIGSWDRLKNQSKYSFQKYVFFHVLKQDGAAIFKK